VWRNKKARRLGQRAVNLLDDANESIFSEKGAFGQDPFTSCARRPTALSEMDWLDA